MVFVSSLNSTGQKLTFNRLYFLVITHTLLYVLWYSDIKAIWKYFRKCDREILINYYTEII